MAPYIETAPFIPIDASLTTSNGDSTTIKYSSFKCWTPKTVLDFLTPAGWFLKNLPRAPFSCQPNNEKVSGSRIGNIQASFVLSQRTP